MTKPDTSTAAAKIMAHQLLNPSEGSPRWFTTMQQAAEMICPLSAERDAAVAALTQSWADGMREAAGIAKVEAENRRQGGSQSLMAQSLIIEAAILAAILKGGAE